MRYTNLGPTGLKVSKFCLGTTTFNNPTEAPEAIKMVHTAIDAGVNFIDTADGYGNQQAEVIVGNAIKGKRQQMIIGTKVYNRVGPGPNDIGLSRKRIMDGVEKSLRCLQTDYIDLYYMHQWDEGTPLEESLRAMDDLVRQGKVRYIGCSNFAAWQIADSHRISELQNLEKIVCTESRYNLISREIEPELMPFCRAKGTGITVFTPTAGGFLTGRYRKGEAPPPGSRLALREWYRKNYYNDASFEFMENFRKIADASGKSMLHMALGWLLAKREVTSVILGASKVSQVEENLKVIDGPLTNDEVAALDKLGA